jgi:molybdate transport system ATP-binding protein
MAMRVMTIPAGETGGRLNLEVTQQGKKAGGLMSRFAADQPWVRLSRASLSRNGRRLLQDVSWRLRPGEHWLVLGANGAGKSTFLRLVRGDIWPDQDSRGERIYVVDGKPEKSPLGFRRISGLCSTDLLSLYRRHHLHVPVREVIASGLFDAPRQLVSLSSDQTEGVQETAARLNIETLLDTSILHLSNGQAQLALVARSLVKNPAVLFLDEIGDSLDTDSRQRLWEIVCGQVSQGTQLILATHKPEDWPVSQAWRLVLENGCQQDPDKLLSQRPTASPRVPRSRSGQETVSLKTLPVRSSAGNGRDKAFQAQNDSHPLISIQQADIVINAHPILRDITWTIHRHEHWGVTGPNGSGKSTLLRLLLGELHPLPGGSIIRRLPGLESLRDLKQAAGFFSPDIEARLTGYQTGLETVISGIYGHIDLHGQVTAQDADLGRAWLDRFGLDHLAERDIRFLSCGELRLLLLLRASINQPELLLVDEPCSGLDTAAAESIKELLGALAAGSCQLIMVSHRLEDFPECVQQRLRLDHGRIQSIDHPGRPSDRENPKHMEP